MSIMKEIHRSLRVCYAVECLKMVTDRLAARKIPYWIDCGTLLGAYREGGVIDSDYDMDIGILDDYADEVKRVVVEGIEQDLWYNPQWTWRDGVIYQLMFPNVFSDEFGFDRHNRIFHLDVSFYKRVENRVISVQQSYDGQERYQTPLKNVTELKMYKFGKYEFTGPSDASSILRMRYGKNYMIPQLMNGDKYWCHSNDNVDREYFEEYMSGGQ